MEEIAHVAQHEEAGDVLDYLQHTFHIDLGGDHLEHFEISNSVSTTFPLFVYGQIHECLVIKETEGRDNLNLNAFICQHWPREYFWNEASFRGPPVV